MTNSVPDERLRAAAQQHRLEWNKKTIHATDAFDDAMREKVDFAQQESNSAMREAAGLVCDGCKHNAVVINVDGGYFHLANGQYVGCVAAPIHERLALKGER